MGSTRQVTLLESWTDGRPTTSANSAPRQSNNSRNNMWSARGGPAGGRGRAVLGSSRRGLVTGRGRGGGRGRGRGRGGQNKLGKSSDSSFFEDEEDQICQQAMGQFELNTSDICKEFESANAATDLPGFDKTAGGIWIYPTNRSVRDYQFQMVQTALFHNTMVSLPTGLGKTFIAAVVMYNFHRWYPNDLVIFMAPTRPLVTQQLEACHNIVGIHPSKTVELTGQTAPKKREELWKSKSVFFLTPQVMTSDLQRGFCPAERVRCVVVDEAHKALGQHAYAQVISMLTEKKAIFRILALSATPGSDLTAVQQVFKNLLISRVELRSETSPDVLPYIHDKQVDKVVVPVEGFLKSVHDNLVEVYQTYTGKLIKQNVLQSREASGFSRFQLLKAKEGFNEKMAHKFPNYMKGYIDLDFLTCISLAHAAELLLNHGLRSFFTYLQALLNKEKGNPAVASELKKNTNLQDVLTDIQEKLNISVANSTFNMSKANLFSSFSKPSNTSFNLEEENPENPPDYLLSHPKMKALKEIIIRHFTSNGMTRVMIFSQYRDSVQEIGNLLNSLKPLVKPMVFIGQAKKGLKQKDQVEVVQRFRDGGYNVLVSTSVGEEGLDIGEVDLIICFDSSKSPTRLVQRMGRTGRQRRGRIIFLLTKGKEERAYNASCSLQNSISKNITDASKLYPYLYKFSPRMVPQGINPQCFKMSIVLTSEQAEDARMEDARMEEVIQIDDEDDVQIVEEHLEKKPVKSDKAKKPAKPKKKSPSEVKLKNPPKKPGRANTNGNGNERTLTQCFDILLQKANQPENSNSTKSSPVKPKESPTANKAEKSVIVEENGYMPGAAAENKDAHILFELFDVNRDPSAALAKPCLNFPKLPKPVEWDPEFNTLNRNSILIRGFDLECLKERIDSYKAINSYRDKCRCGNMGNGSPDPVEAAKNFIYPENVPDDIWSTVNKSDSKCIDDEKLASRLEISREIGLDEGFVFDENDPFFDDGWLGDDDDEVLANIENSNTIDNPSEYKAPKTELTLPDFSPIPILDDSFEELPFDELETRNGVNVENNSVSSTTSFEEFGTPVRKSQNPKATSVVIISPTPQKPSPCNPPPVINSKPTLLKPCLIDIPDDSSTTSNDDFFSPKRPPPREIEKSRNEPVIIERPESESQAKSQVNRDLFKDDLLLFEDDDEFEQIVNKSTFHIPNAGPNDASKDLFEITDPAIPTSPERTVDIFPSNTPPYESPEPVDPDLSPDLSQFRFQNRIKRIKLEDRKALNCSQMLNPNNRSAELLNQYVREMRIKNEVLSQQKVKSPVKLKIAIFSPEKPSQNDTSTADSSKKKFRFKKKSVPEEITGSAQTITSSSTSLSKPNINIKPSLTELDKKVTVPNLDLSTKENIVPTTVDKKSTCSKKPVISQAPPPVEDPNSSITSNSIWDTLLDDDWIDLTINKNVQPEKEKKKSGFKFKPAGKSQTSSSVPTANIPTPQVFKTSSSSSIVKNNRDVNLTGSKLSRNTSFVKKPADVWQPEYSKPEVRQPEFSKPEVRQPDSIKPMIRQLDYSRPIFNRSYAQKSQNTSILEVSNQMPKNTPLEPFKLPFPPKITPVVFVDDDDDFVHPVKPLPATPKRNLESSFRKTVESPQSPYFDSLMLNQQSHLTSSPKPSQSPDAPTISRKAKRTRKKRRLNANPFIEVEADVEDDDSSSVDEEDEFDGLDELDDSFVDNENSETITDSQQVRYIRSIKDFEPLPLPPRPIQRVVVDSPHSEYLDDPDYESDSFCVANDDVELDDIGVFTQAMNVAKEAVLKENPRSAKKRRTRRQARQAAVARANAPPESLSPSSSKVNSNFNKRRRRIIFQADSSEED